jgi:hypothetical protein
LMAISARGNRRRNQRELREHPLDSPWSKWEKRNPRAATTPGALDYHRIEHRVSGNAGDLQANMAERVTQ